MCVMYKVATKTPVQHLTMWKSNFHVLDVFECYSKAFGRCRRTETNVLYLFESQQQQQQNIKRALDINKNLFNNDNKNTRKTSSSKNKTQ